MWGSLRLTPIRSCELEFRVHNHEFRVLCQLLSLFRVHAGPGLGPSLGFGPGLTWATFVRGFCPALCPVTVPVFSFQPPRFCPSFCTGPVLEAVFLCWRRFCTRWNTGSDYAPYPPYCWSYGNKKSERFLWTGIVADVKKMVRG